jgi:hypothetical protein
VVLLRPAFAFSASFWKILFCDLCVVWRQNLRPLSLKAPTLPRIPRLNCRATAAHFLFLFSAFPLSTLNPQPFFGATSTPNAHYEAWHRSKVQGLFDT